MYHASTLKQAILFNTAEIIPTNTAQMDSEIEALCTHANETGSAIRHYIGFEISGQIHIGTGIACALKIKQLQDAGIHCSIYLANYHAWLNNKLDGTFETIEAVARQYFAPLMQVCLETVGCHMQQVDMVFAHDLYRTTPRGLSYFDWDIRICKELTLARVLKSISVMGKKEGDAVEFATLRYPAMQVTDAFFMQTHLVHAGMDQRKCHVLMREIADKLPDEVALRIGTTRTKPIAIHHALLLGMSAPKIPGEGAKMDATTIEDHKMSKSKPDSAIWVTDSHEEIMRKLKKAYCPMPDATKSLAENTALQTWNPMLDWCKKLLFPAGKTLHISRPTQWGGDVSFDDFDQLHAAYMAGDIHPMDLKTGVGSALSTWFLPMQAWASEHPAAIALITQARSAAVS
jgi:tyrosyl-tRNA synthetase